MSLRQADKAPLEGRQVEAVTDRLRACGVIPVVQLPRPERAAPLVETLLRFGLPCLEVTFRAAGAADAIATVRSRFPEMLVGAGTVLTVDDAAQALDSGAHFVVAPGTNSSVVDFVLSHGGTILPGVATPSEIEANLARSITTMKFFPAAALGGRVWLQAVQGPFRAVQFVPTGGVTAANLRGYLDLANVVACGGTWLAPPAVLERGDFDLIGRTVREAVAIVSAARGFTVGNP